MPMPERVLLLTYDRLDHAFTTLEKSVVGVPRDRKSITKAKRVRIGDWVVIRISRLTDDNPFQEFVACRPARVVGKPVEAAELIWPEEIERSMVIYPLRIPVKFDSGSTDPSRITWDSLCALGIRGRDGSLLETPQQWGQKFCTNVLDDPAQVRAFVNLIVGPCTGAEAARDAGDTELVTVAHDAPA